MSDEQHSSQHGPLGGLVGGGQECVICPVCVLLQAVSATRPEVTRHLLAAGRELTLALQAVLEDHMEAHDAAREGVERIDVE